jgi:putative flippase GtrA
MAAFTNKDLLFSIITGVLTGLIAWRIFDFLDIERLGGISYAWFILIIPILWFLGVNLGYFLGRWIPFFNQFGKFVAIGFTNASVDFGVLNLLIASTSIATGFYFSVFKGISFMVGLTHSYFWNKHWVFASGGGENKYQFVKFFSVMMISIAVNVLVASIIVNGVDPMFSLNENMWANVGAIIGAAGGLAFSFTGFRMIVFK